MPSLTKDCQESQRALSRLVAKAWLDEGFKERLLSNPAAVLEENGLTLPSGVEVRVNENTSLESIKNIDANLNSNQVYEIPLPPKPAGLKDSQIQSWANGNDSELAVGTF
jgi:hypothetical protein